jgi:valyl-tRNA synthetase
MDDFGRLTNAGEFDGLKLSDAKEKILEKFKSEGKLISSKPLQQAIKVHDRCKTPVEFANSFQWFAKITQKKDEIKSWARKIAWHPEFAIAHLDNWADYVEWDWVISRQRIFGTPIPFWICAKCGHEIGANENELPAYPANTIKKCPKCGGEAKGETSVFDCWVDSSISPLAISRWEEDEEFFKKTLVEAGMINEEDLSIYTMTDNEDEILEIIKKAPVRLGLKYEAGQELEEREKNEKDHEPLSGLFRKS